MAKRRRIKHERPEVSDDLTESIVTSIRASCGEESATVMSAYEDVLTAEVRQWISTDLIWLDDAVSDGRGLPSGKILEIFGPESTGKTSLCQYLIRKFQSLGGLAVYLDFETSMDKQQLIGYGLDLGNLIYVDVETIEQGFDALVATLNTIKGNPDKYGKIPILFIWDSVAAASPKAEDEEGSHTDSHVGLQARAMSKGMRKIRRRVAKANATVLFTNQIRDKIGVMFGKKTTTPGGRALKFHASIRLETYRAKTMKRSKNGVEVITGYLIGVNVIKTRFAPPLQTAELVLSFKRGFDPEMSILHYLKKLKLIRAAGKSVSGKATNGESIKLVDWRTFYKDNRKEIESKIHAVVFEEDSDDDSTD